MYFSKYYTLILVCILSIFHLSGQEDKTRLRKEVEKIIKYDTKLDYTLTPAFILMVIDGEYQEAMVFSNGVMSTNDNVLNDQSIFELGSISKTISIEILKGLKKDGLLSEEDYVNNVLPENYINSRLKDFRIEDILSLNSPLPNVIKGMGFYESDASNPYEHLKKDDLLKIYKSYIPENKGANVSYSDIDFAILEIAMEHVSGLSFDALLEKYINDPLGSSFFTTGYEQKEGLVVSGLNRSGIPGEAYQFLSFGGSVGIKGNLSDLSKLVTHWIHSKDSEVNKQTFKTLPKTWTEKLRVDEGFYIMDVGRGSFPYLTNGLTNIHHSFIGFVPQTETAVICLSASGTSTEDFSMLVLRMINRNWKGKK